MSFLTHFASGDLEQQIASLGIRTVLIAAGILIVFTLLAALLKNRVPALKLPMFIIMSATLVISTAILFGSTIYLNNKSESKGPVHWHADIEFWACGAELELRDPTGFLSNKIGTSTYHEHNDKRIHLEGVVVRKVEDASLTKFMRVTGGYLRPDAIAVPLNDEPDEWLAQGDKLDGDAQHPDRLNQLQQYVKYGEDGPVMELKNGADCNGQPAELQVFVYTYNKEDDTYRQRKLADPTSYLLRDEAIVPPGDCVIVEFDAAKDRTDKLCEQYGVRDSVRCTDFGVERYNPELCNIQELVPLPSEEEPHDHDHSHDDSDGHTHGVSDINDDGAFHEPTDEEPALTGSEGDGI